MQKNFPISRMGEFCLSKSNNYLFLETSQHNWLCQNLTGSWSRSRVFVQHVLVEFTKLCRVPFIQRLGRLRNNLGDEAGCGVCRKLENKVSIRLQFFTCEVLRQWLLLKLITSNRNKFWHLNCIFWVCVLWKLVHADPKEKSYFHSSN